MANMKTPKWLFRLEAVSPDNGLWYNAKNELVWGIGKLADCTTKNLPMGYDEKYHLDGKNWHSSCSNIEDLTHWYSLEDARRLMNDGFVFTSYLATEYEEYPMETCFVKDTSIKRVEFSYEDLVKIWKSI